MYTISTAALVSVVALASSLAVVVQAQNSEVTKHFRNAGCQSYDMAVVTSCQDWRINFAPEPSVKEMIGWVVNNNRDVNPACTNLIIGDYVRVFLL